VREADDCGLRDFRVGDERAFNLRRADAVAGDVEDIIDAPRNPPIAVFIAPAPSPVKYMPG